MNTCLLLAAIFTFLLGIIHSYLGERLIFRHRRRKGKLVPSLDSADLKEAHLRIIWATWHLASVFGWGLGAVFLKLALEPELIQDPLAGFFVTVSAGAMLAGAVLVLIGTRGRHPGWVVLSVIGGLLLLG